MGQKVHPISFRIGITEDWRSRWYASKKEFGALVVADKKIRDFIKANYAFALIARIDIERTREETRVTLHCGRPGVIIGRKGAEVDRLRARLEEIVGGKVDIRVDRDPPSGTQRAAGGRRRSPSSLTKRASFKRAIRKAAETTMDAGAKGVRIRLAGRLGGAEMSRTRDDQHRFHSAAHAARENGLRLRRSPYDHGPYRRQGLDPSRPWQRGRAAEPQKETARAVDA